MRASPLYGVLGTFALGTAAVAVVLAIVALALGGGMPAIASGVCATVFAVPGLLFMLEARRSTVRDAALTHVASLVEERGVIEAADIARALGTPSEDADRILGSPPAPSLDLV